MAVSKTTETRCRAGSVQERQGIQALHKYPHPYIFFFHRQCCFPVILENSLRRMSHAKKIPLHFWKMFFILVCVLFCCTIVHHIGKCYSYTLLSAVKNKSVKPPSYLLLLYISDSTL